MKYLQITIVIILHSFFLVQVRAQCYFKLADLSGVEESNASLLEEASCRLRDSFPENMRSNVGVYDFGCYVYNAAMGGEDKINQIFTEMEAQINKPWYIIFARVSDENGIYSRLMVRIKFPSGQGNFNCIYEEDIEGYKHYLPAYLMEKYSSLSGLAANATLAITSTINEYASFVGDKGRCCSPGFRSSCSSSLADEQIESTLSSEGYLSLSGVNVQVSNATINAGDYFSSTISLVIDGKNIDNLLKNYSEELNYYFKSQIILRKNELIGQLPENQKDDNFLIGIFVVAQKFSNGKYKAFVKFNNTSSLNNTPKIWLVRLKGAASFNAEEVESRIKEYIKAICGKDIAIESLTGDNDPNSKFNRTTLSPSDRIILIGKSTSKILSFLNTNQTICSMIGVANKNLFLSDVILNAKNEKYNSRTPEGKQKIFIPVEVADAEQFNKYDVVGYINQDELSNTKSAFRISTIDETIAFLTVHLLGHQAVGPHNLEANKNQYVSQHIPDYWMSTGKGIEEYMHLKDKNGNYLMSSILDLLANQSKYDYIPKYNLELLNKELCQDLF